MLYGIASILNFLRPLLLMKPLCALNSWICPKAPRSQMSHTSKKPNSLLIHLLKLVNQFMIQIVLFVLFVDSEPITRCLPLHWSVVLFFPSSNYVPRFLPLTNKIPKIIMELTMAKPLSWWIQGTMVVVAILTVVVEAAMQASVVPLAVGEIAGPGTTTIINDLLLEPSATTIINNLRIPSSRNTLLRA